MYKSDFLHNKLSFNINVKRIFLIIIALFRQFSCFSSTEISTGIYDDLVAGQELVVDVNVNTTVNLSDFTIVVAYNDNGDILEFDANNSGLNISNRGSFDFLDADTTENSIKFVFGGLSSDFAVTPGSGTLFSFKLIARQAGSSSLSFPVIMPCVPGLDCEQFPDPVTSVTSGMITVVPSLSINNASPIIEGDSGSRLAINFSVSLNHITSEQISVDYSTINGTASDEFGDNDFESQSGTLIFSTSGSLSQIITIMTNGDDKLEGNETFSVILSNANIPISRNAGLGTINNDDETSLSIDDIALSEGNSGINTSFTFTVSLNNPSDFGITVNYSTQNDTALLSDSDYQFNSSVLTFNPGETARTISIFVIGDSQPEIAEHFQVNLTNTQLIGNSNQKLLAIKDGQGMGTILDDDKALPEINSITRAFVHSEGDSDRLNFLVTFSRVVRFVNQDDFITDLIAGALMPQPIVESVVKNNGRDHEYLVSVSAHSGQATIGLELTSNNIEDLLGNQLAETPFLPNQSFDIWENELSIEKGWNLISFPGPVFKSHVSNIIPGSLTSIWSWNGSNFTKINDTQGIAKLGFWIYFLGGGASLPIRGVNAESMSTNLQPGWNLVGVSAPKNPQSNSSIKFPIWFWQNNKYIVADELQPFAAYWVFAKGKALL